MISFFVPGTPRPQGSKRGFVNRHTGKVALVESAGAPLKDWRGDVKWMATLAMGETPPFDGPVALVLEFKLSRPKSHSKTKVTYPTSQRGDLDKYCRAVFDALSSVCYLDDAQITRLYAVKQWANSPDGPGVLIKVWEESLEAWSVEAAQRQPV